MDETFQLKDRVAKWIKNKNPAIYCLSETHLKLKVKGWKNKFHADENDKKAEVIILISDKIDFKTETMKINDPL